MHTKRYLALAVPTLLAIVSVGASRELMLQHHDHSQHGAKKEQAHLDGVNGRGDHAMGFSHEKTEHHFKLMPGGGAIEVSANDPKDAERRHQIRRHLEHISNLFA